MRRKMAMRPTDRPMKKAIRPGMTRPKRRPTRPSAKAAAALGKKGLAGGIAALKNQAAATAKAPKISGDGLTPVRRKRAMSRRRTSEARARAGNRRRRGLR